MRSASERFRGQVKAFLGSKFIDATHTNKSLIFAFFLLAFFFARIGFYETPSSDDLLFWNLKNPLETFAIGTGVSGRFVPAEIMLLFVGLGVAPAVFVWTFSMLAAIAFVLLAFAIVLSLYRNVSVYLLLAYGAIICLHPYTISLMQTQVAQLHNFLSFIFLLLAVIVLRSHLSAISRTILCTTLIFFVVSSYQSFVFYFIVFSLSHALVARQHSLDKIADIAIGGASTCLALVIYLFVYKQFQPVYIEQLPSTGEMEFIFAYQNFSRSSFLPLAELPYSFGFYLIFLLRAVVLDEIIFSAWHKGLVLAAIIVPAVIVFFSRSGRMVAVDWLNLLIIALLVICYGNLLVVVVDYYAYPPRGYMHGAVVVVALLIAVRQATKGALRSFVTAATLVIAGWMVVQSARLSAAEPRVFSADEQIARQIYQRIGKLNDDPSAVRYTPIGYIPYDSEHLSEFPGYYAVNRSRFTAPQSVIPMLSLVAGRRLEMAPFDTIPAARAACAAQAPYPGPALVLADGDVIIICLEDWRYYPDYAPRAYAPDRS